MLHIITLLILSAIPAHAGCAGVSTGVWACTSTGVPSTDGAAVAAFFSSKPFACGDRIILDAGATYRGAETTPVGPFIPLKGQTGCNGKKTSIESSRLSEIPPNQKERLANYRSYMPTIEVGANSAFALWSDANGGTNGYALRGIRITPSAYTVANRLRMSILVFNNEFLWTDTNLRLYSPRDIEIDRCIMEDYEDAVYGDPNTSNTDGNAFLRSVSLGIDGPFQNLYVHDSFLKFDGYSNTSGAAGTTDWIDISTVTATNPAVIQGTTLTTALGLTYNAGCTGVCGGLDDPGDCALACKRVVIRGGTGAWAALNGPKGVRARADGNVDVFVPNPNYTRGHTAFDASGLGSFTATSPDMASVVGLVQYAISAGPTASNWRIHDNFIESWAMPIFLGGADGPPIDPGIIQSGSTDTSLVLNHVRNLKVGMGVTFAVPAGSGPSDYCVLGAAGSGCYAVDNFRVGRVTAISGTTVTLETWGSDGLDGTAPEVGGEAIWDTWKVQGIQVRGNAISRGHLHSNASVGKGVAEVKKCINCLFDGNSMGGYLDANNVMRGNVGGTYFMESSNQGGKEPNYIINNTRWSNNLGAGQLGGGGISCLWGNALINNYVHYHSAITQEKLFYEHNIAVGCQATPIVQQTHINMSSALNSHYKHNTFAPDMAQTEAYRFFMNGDCVPTLATTFSFFPEIGRSYNAGVKDNIIGVGDGWAVGNNNGTPDAATCWPTLANDIQKNILVDTESIGTSSINSTFPNNFPVADYASFWAGTCAYDSWTNCKLASGNANRGAASDGKDPGADIEQVNDRLHRWSEHAGLIYADIAAADMALRAGNWSIGSTAAAVRFQVFESLSSACTVELFTAGNRDTGSRHADAASAQACNRASSATSGNVVSYVFGGASALTANTMYYYRIVDGNRVMVGEFKTLPAGAASIVFNYNYSSARAGNVCTNAAMDAGCSSISSAAAHSVTVPQGAIRYYQAAGGRVIPVVAP